MKTNNKFTQNLNRQITFAKKSKADYHRVDKKAVELRKRIVAHEQQRKKELWDALDEI